MSRRIAVILGGRSSENPISIASAASVIAALEEGGHEVVSVQIDREGRWQLEQGQRRFLPPAPGTDLERLPGRDVAATLADVDVVFPVLHGPFGEDGTVQGLLELAGVPYVGAGVLASALCMDKDVFKSVLRDHDIPVTENITLRLGDPPRNPFGYPCFVKPARLGSSVGITKAHDDDELEAGVRLAFEHDEKVLVERFVEGVEIEVGVLGNREPVASLPGEIVVTHNEWYDFEAKYDEGEMNLIVPARVEEAQLERAQELAVRAFIATDCEGMARADLFVRHDGEVLVNELNTIPGFTSTSVYAQLFAASGVPYGELLERLAALAVERFDRRGQLRLTSLRRFWNPWRLLAVRHPMLSADDRSAFDELLEETADGAVIDYRLPQPKWWFLHHQIERGFLIHGSNEPAIAEFRTRANLDAHQRPIEAVFASDDAIWPLYFAVVNRPVAQSYINWCEHVGGRSRYLFSIGSDPQDERSWTTGTIYLLPQATFRATPDSRELVSEVPVRPRARLTVEPGDFPFHDRTRGHRRGESVRSVSLRNALRLR